MDDLTEIDQLLHKAAWRKASGFYERLRRRVARLAIRSPRGRLVTRVACLEVELIALKQEAAMLRSMVDEKGRTHDSFIRVQRLSDHAIELHKVLTNDLIAKAEKRRAALSLGAKRKLENATPNPEQETVLAYALEHPNARPVQIKMRLKLKASDRTIRRWLANR